ncbi:YkvA family protein [Anaerovorax odorimutans]|uniref:YkvA family protein n=1 Tax=Anaerovorax odorimutans TaxID=109327 RepID=UPI001A997ED8|nr:DUF1232 domain-containing protein [Anaerovorax odorimutans]
MNIKNIISKLMTKLTALSLAYKRSDTPLMAKIIAFITVSYALSPIDLIPDFIPILGYLDDMVILPLLIALAVKLIPANIMDKCIIQAKDMWQNGKPKNWRYALPVIIIWVFIAVLVTYNLTNK